MSIWPKMFTGDVHAVVLIIVVVVVVVSRGIYFPPHQVLELRGVQNSNMVAVCFSSLCGFHCTTPSNRKGIVVVITVLPFRITRLSPRYPSINILLPIYLYLWLYIYIYIYIYIYSLASG
jgi:hypothetical protein